MKKKTTHTAPVIAYFSMEIALDPGMPTYAGGLGVLAGDTIRSAADLGLAFVGMTLLHRKGYFQQQLSAEGQQREEIISWPVADFVEELEARAEVRIEGRRVVLRAWRYRVRGSRGNQVPVFLLDSDLPENHPADRHLTDSLYGGNERYRLAQEALLGIGGVRMLRALGYTDVDRFHLNEGHAALAVLALCEELCGEPGATASDVPVAAENLGEALAKIRPHCVFTTHTPVPAGHDKFSPALVQLVLGENVSERLAALGQKDSVNLTDLALRFSHFVNGVAMRHGEVSRSMFPQYPIRSITNGIHPATWAAPAFHALFDRHIRDWQQDTFALRYAVNVPLREIESAHGRAKAELIAEIQRREKVTFQQNVFTIGFARRATAYKRPHLFFHDLQALRVMAEQTGPFQLVMAGKAHPADTEGKALIQQVFAARRALGGDIPVIYLANYDMTLAKLLCAGCDLWLNTPTPPLEASGTSGMKAALNGVPSLSILDGWWVEGHMEGVTGWVIESAEGSDGTSAERHDAAALYAKLGGTILPCYYQQPTHYTQIMRNTIALNASFFNTQRMLLQYLYDAYMG